MTGFEDDLETGLSAAGLTARPHQRQRTCRIACQKCPPWEYDIDFGGTGSHGRRTLRRGACRIQLSCREIRHRRHRYARAGKTVQRSTDQARPGAQGSDMSNWRSGIRGQRTDDLSIVAVVERRQIEHAEQASGQGGIVCSIRHGYCPAGTLTGPQFSVICLVAAP